MFKKFLSLLLSCLLAFTTVLCAFAKESETGNSLDLQVKSAVLVDGQSGAVLYSVNPHKRLPLASVTKVMTMLLVMEAMEEGKVKYQDKITCSEKAASMGGSQIWMEPGETFTVEELLKAVAVASANDACTALSEFVAGSDTAFVSAMNTRAKELGMTDTHFDNCTGLDDTTDAQYSSASDIAIMSRELLKYENILDFTTIWMDSLRGGKTELVNTNRLIKSYSGITGLKTGTTSKAGFCMSASASRDGTKLISVVMGSKTSEDRFKSAAALLDYGFANYESVSPRVSTDSFNPVSVEFGSVSAIYPHLQTQPFVLVPKGRGGEVETVVKCEKSLSAPLKAGQQVGKLVFKLDGKVVGEAALVCGESVARLNFFSVLWTLLCPASKN